MLSSQNHSASGHVPVDRTISIPRRSVHNKRVTRQGCIVTASRSSGAAIGSAGSAGKVGVNCFGIDKAESIASRSAKPAVSRRLSVPTFATSKRLPCWSSKCRPAGLIDISSSIPARSHLSDEVLTALPDQLEFFVKSPVLLMKAVVGR